jgi:hypothetical protein
MLELCSKLTVSSIVVSKMKDGYAEVLKQRNARTLFIFDRVIIVSTFKDNNTDVPEKIMLELFSYLTVPLLCRQLKVIIPKYTRKKCHDCILIFVFFVVISLDFLMANTHSYFDCQMLNLRNVMFVPVVKFLLRSPFCLRRKIVWKCVDAEVQSYIHLFIWYTLPEHLSSPPGF